MFAKRSDLVFDLLLVAVLLAGAALRFTGLDWDEGTYLHPDERFLAIVGSKIEPVESFSEYWNTEVSRLNPNNKGEGFFVYGTLPIFLVRYVMEAVGQSGYGATALYGRPLAAAFDLLTVFLLYLTAARLYDRRVALIAAAFSAFAVFQIQLSHFFTVDIFANFFIWLALYLGSRILTAPRAAETGPADGGEALGPAGLPRLAARAASHPLAKPALLFGVAAGMAAASKVSAFPIALMLPLAAWMYTAQYAWSDRNRQYVITAGLLAVSGVLAALSFRVFQPYAFSGPGFFGLVPNPIWLETLGRLQDLVQPSFGYPPSIQWFDRPIWFSGKNLTLWGLGLPLGLAAWVGLAWMGFRIMRGESHPHLFVWTWVVGHFVWQSLGPNPTMRYQLPVYPGMALAAAWGIVSAWDAVRNLEPGRSRRFLGAAAWLGGAAVLALTLFYAAAFVRIYRTDVTRLEASRWIYDNLPGALTLRVQGSESAFAQLLPFPNGHAVRPGEPFQASFQARDSGMLQEVFTPHLVSGAGGAAEGTLLFLSVSIDPLGEELLASGSVKPDFGDPEQTLFFGFENPAQLEALETYYLAVHLVGDAGRVEICQPISLFLDAEGVSGQVLVPSPADCALTGEQPYITAFAPEVGGLLASAVVAPPITYLPLESDRRIELTVQDGSGAQVLARSEVSFSGPADDVSFILDRPVSLIAGETYSISVAVTDGPPFALHGTVLAQETSWDDPLPMRVDGYDGFGGIYRGDNNLELYWEDNPEKAERIIRVLDNVDVIPISSSRQWGSLTRLPERWPLVDLYFRNLMGCPPEQTVEWCYNVAEPGMFAGQLGFELVETFVSNPGFFGVEIPDQASEEAFTVYDHPKVFIFVKTDDYDSQYVRALFGNAPLAQIPGSEPASPPASESKPLLMDPARQALQRVSDTWSSLFSRDSALNRFQPLAVVVWYGAVSVVGWLAYPLIRPLLPGLDDRGYPFARTAGLLLTAYAAWLMGSAGIAMTRSILSLVFLAFAGAGVWGAYAQRDALAAELREKRGYFISVEAFALLLFLFLLFIRIANPDLWHPWKGGEKPMDFAYFNAVLKSATFPPYDPWFAGGYINYYYWGYVFVGVLDKWLGIIPSIAYNLIVPTLFMLVGIGAFSIGWNLVRRPGGRREQDHDEVLLEGNLENVRPGSQRMAAVSGLAAALGVTLLGNLGTLRMILQGFQRVAAAPGVVLEETFVLTRWVWTVRGFFAVLTTQAEFPYALADWYWNPSRVIPAPGDVEPITEFPFFTFLYADLHAHMIAIPITLLALAWALSVILGRGRWSSGLLGALSFAFGGLVIGALRPTNTWDYPTYLALGVIAVGYTAWKYWAPAIAQRLEGLPVWASGGLSAVSGGLWLTGLSWFLFQPYTRYYALGYTEVRVWSGPHTPFTSYLTHWGVFLFILVTWMLWETREWLAATPAVAGLRFLRSRLEFILAGWVLLIGAAAWLMVEVEVSIAFPVLALAAWAGVLMLRPGLSDARRIVFFLTGTGIFLTLMVEAVVLSGDIGRMNTVFKFYLQVWILLAVGAAAALGWLLPAINRWAPAWGRAWRIGLGFLVFSAALYPLLGGYARIRDRMVEAAPNTLDGMAYMQHARYFDQGRELDLREDYEAIRWMQENVEGTPVIVEGQVVEYHWGSRYSIYTGLPTVLGWNWHQRQQRTGHDLDVWDRAGRVEEFYTTTNVNIANRFLDEFDVGYIIVGQMEQAYYGGPGLEKFDIFDGRYWEAVYRDGETAIYRVIR